MGVESYTLSDDTTLYVADSIDTLEAVEDYPDSDRVASLMVDAGSAAFLVEKEYDHTPSQREVKEAYPVLGNSLYKALVEHGVYTKEQYLAKSHPEVDLPEELESAFDQEQVNLREILVKEERPKVSLLTLAWLLSVGELSQT